MVIHTHVISSEKCQKTSIGPNVANFHICSLAKRHVGACYGDSGGPLVWNNTMVGGKTINCIIQTIILISLYSFIFAKKVANFVQPCATGVPDVFSSVAYFHDWIKNTTKCCDETLAMNNETLTIDNEPPTINYETYPTDNETLSETT